jgi:hypothetical protein
MIAINLTPKRTMEEKNELDVKTRNNPKIKGMQMCRKGRL